MNTFVTCEWQIFQAGGWHRRFYKRNAITDLANKVESNCTGRGFRDFDCSHPERMKRDRRMFNHRSASVKNDRSDRWRDRIGRRLADEFRNAVKHCLKSHWARPDGSWRAAVDPACRCSSGWHRAETSVEWSTMGLEEWSSPPNHSVLCVVEFHVHVYRTRSKRSIERRVPRRRRSAKWGQWFQSWLNRNEQELYRCREKRDIRTRSKTVECSWRDGWSIDERRRRASSMNRISFFANEGIGRVYNETKIDELLIRTCWPRFRWIFKALTSEEIVNLSHSMSQLFLKVKIASTGIDRAKRWKSSSSLDSIRNVSLASAFNTLVRPWFGPLTA